MKDHFHNPNKHVLELLTQAQQDRLENGYGTGASGFDYTTSMRIPGASVNRPSADGWDGDDLDSPFLSRDRRFIIRIPQNEKRKRALGF